MSSICVSKPNQTTVWCDDFEVSIIKSSVSKNNNFQADILNLTFVFE